MVAGRVHVLYGTRSGLHADATATTPNDQLITSPFPDGEFGWALAAGDFNGDGCSDLAIGAPVSLIPGRGWCHPRGFCADLQRVADRSEPGGAARCDRRGRRSHASQFRRVRFHAGGRGLQPRRQKGPGHHAPRARTQTPARCTSCRVAAGRRIGLCPARAVSRPETAATMISGLRWRWVTSTPTVSVTWPSASPVSTRARVRWW